MPNQGISNFHGLHAGDVKQLCEPLAQSNFVFIDLIDGCEY